VRLLKGLFFFALFSNACEGELDVVDFDLSTVRKIVSQEKPKNVAEFLSSALIPDSVRQRFLLLKKSFSIQKANEDCPRVLMYNSDTSLVLSFNCGTGGGDWVEEHGDTSVEVALLNRKTGAYENYDISFASDSDPKLSEVNPDICLECHHSKDTVFMGSNWKWFSDVERDRFVSKVQRAEIHDFERFRRLIWGGQTSLEELQSMATKTWSKFEGLAIQPLRLPGPRN